MVLTCYYPFQNFCYVKLIRKLKKEGDFAAFLIFLETEVEKNDKSE